MRSHASMQIGVSLGSIPATAPLGQHLRHWHELWNDGPRRPPAPPDEPTPLLLLLLLGEDPPPLLLLKLQLLPDAMIALFPMLQLLLLLGVLEPELPPFCPFCPLFPPHCTVFWLPLPPPCPPPFPPFQFWPLLPPPLLCKGTESLSLSPSLWQSTFSCAM